MTNIAISAAAPVAVESLSVITYQQRPVLTSDLLAKLYGTGESNIHDNYRKNIERFAEGKHFVKLEGEALREFKKAQTGKFPVSPRTRNLILWTERGAARHAKMLDTEQAWEVFERLEDSYFVRPRTEATPYVQNPGDTLSLEQSDRLRDMLTEAAEQLPEHVQGAFLRTGWSKLKAHFKVAYRKIPAQEFTEAASIVARHIAEHAPPVSLAPPAPEPSERLLMERAPDGGYTVRPLSSRVAIVEMSDFVRMQALLALVADFAPRELLPDLVAAANRRLRTPRHAALR